MIGALISFIEAAWRVLFVVFGLALAFVILAAPPRKNSAPAAVSVPAAPPAPLDLTGLTLPEVEASHGPALSRDAATGWALWPTFRARFAAGRVEQTEPLTSDF